MENFMGKKIKNWHLQSEINKQFEYKTKILKDFWIQSTINNKWKLTENHEIKITNMQGTMGRYKWLIKHFWWFE